jgi:hypothetical protein
MFAMDYVREEGLVDHSVHTAVIDRKGKLAAKIEGNRFTAEQLADLVSSVLSKHAQRQDCAVLPTHRRFSCYNPAKS